MAEKVSIPFNVNDEKMSNREEKAKDGFSVGKILDGKVLTATYVFKNEDFDLKRAINIASLFDFLSTFH